MAAPAPGEEEDEDATGEGTGAPPPGPAEAAAFATASGAAAGTGEPGDDPVGHLVDQAEALAAPAIDAMLAAIGAAFAEARDYDDLSLRLAALSGSLDPGDFASVIEQAFTVADLAGRDEVMTEAADGR
nr:DUF935 family protein [Methylobrevis pamukkalensis]